MFVRVPKRSSALPIIACVLAVTWFPQSSTARTRPGTGKARPTNYLSPSGVYNLFVDPAERWGGGAKYRLSNNDVDIWSGQKPYTLRDVVVTDEGRVAGFAYRTERTKTDAAPRRTHGERKGDPPVYFHIVILDSFGHEVLNDTREKTPFRRTSSHPPPTLPYIEQFLVDPPDDRLIARVVVPGDSPWGVARWWVYRLSTGESLTRFDPKERMKSTENLRYVVDARAVAGTPLLLVHWYVKGPDHKVKDHSGRFTLLDEDYEPVWSLDAIDDYNEVKLRMHSRATPKDYFAKHPAILQTDQTNRFDLRFFAENKQVSFAVSRGKNGQYEVKELRRKDFLESPVP